MRRRGTALAAGILALAAATAPLAPAQAAQAGTWLLVIAGVGGDAAHRESFVALSGRLIDSARDEHGVPASQIVWLAEDVEATGGRAAGRSTADGVRAAFADLAERSARGDRVLVVLIGHGSARGREARFNIPGPDLGASDFVDLLAALDGRDVAFVNTTSASGGFITPLSAPGRTVVTSTRNTREQEEPHFVEYFVAAFENHAADTDKDRQVSILEAFTYAAAETERLYEEEGRMRPEHALLDDNGDGEGSGEPGGESSDGALANRFVVGGVLGGASIAGGGADPDADPRLAELLAARAAAQERLDELRAVKDVLPEEEYLESLEELLVRIAEIDAEIRALEGTES